MTDTYDGIILGAGHNGLILQAYLGKAGFKTLAIERKAVAGGGLATLEDPRHPGFLHNTHAFFQRAITTMPWYADLELERHGARYIEPELNVALITREGRALGAVGRHHDDLGVAAFHVGREHGRGAPSGYGLAEYDVTVREVDADVVLDQRDVADAVTLVAVERVLPDRPRDVRRCAGGRGKAEQKKQPEKPHHHLSLL